MAKKMVGAKSGGKTGSGKVAQSNTWKGPRKGGKKGC
jgi:hypothetical protein